MPKSDAVDILRGQRDAKLAAMDFYRADLRQDDSYLIEVYLISAVNNYADAQAFLGQVQAEEIFSKALSLLVSAHPTSDEVYKGALHLIDHYRDLTLAAIHARPERHRYDFVPLPLAA